MRRRIKKLFSPEAQATAKGVLVDLLTVAKDGTDFVPGAGLIFGGMLLILEGLDKSAENAQVLEELRKHIKALQEIFAGSEESDLSPEANKEIEKLKTELEDVTNKLKDRASHGRSRRFTNRKYDEGDLRLLSDSINPSLIRFRTSRELRLEKEKKQREFSRLLDRLPAVKDASFDSTNRANAPSTCFEGTRVDVLKRIQDWIEAPDDGNVPPIFWVNGLAGIGKSTIAQTVAERNSKAGLLGASFFFSRMEAARSNSTLVLPTIAYQLAHLNDKLKHRVADAVKNSNIADVKVLSTQMEKLIIEPLLNVQLQRKLVIVLDALDECDAQGARELLQLLLSPPQKFPFSIRILVTSRPEYHIRAVFKEPPNLQPLNYSKFVLHLDIEEFVVRDDISRFLRAILRLLPERLGIDLPEDWVEEAQFEALAERAGKLFIYCATAIRFIGNPVMPDPRSRLKMLLDTDSGVATNAPYAELDRLYVQVLSNALKESVDSPIPESFYQRYQSIVGSIVLLRDPLPMKSLARFTEHQVSDIELTLFGLHSIIVVPSGDEPPSIYHPSLPDFITDPDRCPDPRLRIDRSSRERWLAIRCLEILTKNLERNIIKIDDSSLWNKEIKDLPARVGKTMSPELQYACSHWASHLAVVESSDAELSKLLEKFTSKYMLYWLEAMSLLENLSLAVSGLQEAHKWAAKMNFEPTITTILEDGHHFVVANLDAIKTAALHVYFSALPFTPRETLLWKTYQHEAKDCVRVVQGIPRMWSDSMNTFFGHSQAISIAAFSLDGSHLLTGSEDTTIRLWDTITGEEISVMNGHSDSITALAFAADGSRIASGSLDSTVRIWDSASGKQIHVLRGHDHWITAVAVSPDGSRVASGSDDETIRLWDTVSGEEIALLRDHMTWIESVTFSSDGLHLVSRSASGKILTWSLSPTPILVTPNSFHPPQDKVPTSLPTTESRLSVESNGRWLNYSSPSALQNTRLCCLPRDFVVSTPLAFFETRVAFGCTGGQAFVLDVPQSSVSST